MAKAYRTNAVRIKKKSHIIKQPEGKSKAICSPSFGARRHTGFYDVSSKAALVIIDGNLQKQDAALAALRKEMAEIIRSISQGNINAV